MGGNCSRNEPPPMGLIKCQFEAGSGGKRLVLQGRRGVILTFNKEGGDSNLSLILGDSPYQLQEGAVVIGSSKDGCYSNTIELSFPWCNKKGILELLDGGASQVILESGDYRWTYVSGFSSVTYKLTRVGAENEIIATYQTKESGPCLKLVTIKLYKPVDSPTLYAALHAVAFTIRSEHYAWAYKHCAINPLGHHW